MLARRTTISSDTACDWPLPARSGVLPLANFSHKAVKLLPVGEVSPVSFPAHVAGYPHALSQYMYWLYTDRKVTSYAAEFPCRNWEVLAPEFCNPTVGAGARSCGDFPPDALTCFASVFWLESLDFPLLANNLHQQLVMLLEDCRLPHYFPSQSFPLR